MQTLNEYIRKPDTHTQKTQLWLSLSFEDFIPARKGGDIGYVCASWGCLHCDAWLVLHFPSLDLRSLLHLHKDQEGWGESYTIIGNIDHFSWGPPLLPQRYPVLAAFSRWQNNKEISLFRNMTIVFQYREVLTIPVFLHFICLPISLFFLNFFF